MGKPEFITFTGYDDQTSIEAMQALSAQYPIEWAMLLSPSRQGADPRYPGEGAQIRFLRSGLRIAAHLCGRHSRDVMSGRSPSLSIDLGSFGRVQINHPDPDPVEIVKSFAGIRCIAQTRDTSFPPDASVDWLFDQSGGRGTTPGRWPDPDCGARLVGYAGGITPENVTDVLKAAAPSGRFWIDMESGVRTENRFDLTKCLAVCQAIYGDRTGKDPADA